MLIQNLTRVNYLAELPKYGYHQHYDKLYGEVRISLYITADRHNYQVCSNVIPWCCTVMHTSTSSTNFSLQYCQNLHPKNWLDGAVTKLPHLVPSLCGGVAELTTFVNFHFLPTYVGT